MMDLLTTLAPTQTAFILKPQAHLRDLLKYTMMDLLLQECLMLQDYDPHPVQGAVRLRDARVAIGRTFQQQEPKLHEMVFLFPFYKKPRKRIVMKHLLQMGLQAAKNELHFTQRLLMDEDLMKSFFKKTFAQKLFGGISLTQKGMEAQQEIIRQMNQYDHQLPPLLKTDKPKALDLIRHIHGNILLLNSFKFDLIHLIGIEIGKVEEDLENGGEDGGA